MNMINKHNHNQQTGSALLISLVIMLVLTLIGLTGMRTSLMEEKMAGNMRDQELAFQAAEAALRDAEQYIELNIIAVNAFDTDGSDGLYNNDDERIWETISWTDSDSLAYTDFNSTDTTGVNVTTAPRYVIQHLASVGAEEDKYNQDGYGQGTGAGAIQTFVITARGTGGSDTSVVYLQSTYGVRL